MSKVAEHLPCKPGRRGWLRGWEPAGASWCDCCSGPLWHRRQCWCTEWATGRSTACPHSWWRTCKRQREKSNSALVAGRPTYLPWLTFLLWPTFLLSPFQFKYYFFYTESDYTIPLLLLRHSPLWSQVINRWRQVPDWGGGEDMIGSWFIFLEPSGNPEAVGEEGAAAGVLTCQLGVISL